MLTDDVLRDLHRRVSEIREREGWQRDHYYECVIVSDLSSVPFERVFEACAEL